jgi:LDH2 family malate/lactate/ureidoglycolate dehydrogenase
LATEQKTLQLKEELDQRQRAVIEFDGKHAAGRILYKPHIPYQLAFCRDASIALIAARRPQHLLSQASASSNALAFSPDSRRDFFA